MEHNNKTSYRRESGHLTLLYRTVQTAFVMSYHLGMEHECDRQMNTLKP